MPNSSKWAKAAAILITATNGERNAIILLNGHSNKPSPNVLSLYPWISVSLSPHQITAFCSKWWLIQTLITAQCV